MKNKINKIALIAFTAIGLLNSCDTENINPLQVAASEEFGAYARVLTISNTNADINDISSSSFDVSIEFIDNEFGSLVTEYKLYATFRDQTIADENDPDNSILTEALLYSYDRSLFADGETFPTLGFTITAEDAFNALDLDIANVEGGDALNYRGEITLSDGRTFTSTNSGDSINSELFYNDAFSFSSQFVCLFSTPPPGLYTIDMVDTYGDGWNGNSIKVTIDGEETYFTIEDGADASGTITIPSGSESGTWEFVIGDYPEEVKFKIYGPSGSIIADVSAPSGGEITLNLCSESL